MIIKADLTQRELEIYIDKSEKELLRINEPKPGLFVAESPNVIKRAIEGGYVPVSFLADEDCLRGNILDLVNEYPEVPCYTADHESIKELTGFPMTKGLLAAFERKESIGPEEILGGKRRIVILENVMNPTNLGAMFRSAAALGIEAVLMTKGCTDPLYRRASRVSMGTVFQVPWAYIEGTHEKWPEAGIKLLKESGYKTVSFALRKDSVDICDPLLKNEDKLAIIMGTEGEGLMDETLNRSDYTVKIPMYHEVDSLNVAAAAAIAFWELTK